jgi:hypothetical protein
MASTSSSRLSGIRTKIERAKHHIRHFNSEWQIFRATNPYGHRIDLDAQAGHEVYRVKIRQQIPTTIPAIIGDAVHNLRSSLDYLAWQLVEVSGGTPGTSTYFPISQTAAKHKTSSHGKVQGMNSKFIAMIDALKPYGGGNDGFWKLHKLDIFDKHQMLAIAAFHVENISLGFRPRPGQTWGIQTRFWGTLTPPFGPGEIPPPGPLRYPMLEDGQEFARRIPPTTPFEMDPDISLSYDISFVEPSVVHAEPVLPLLTQLTELVESVVDGFEPFVI